MIDALRQQLLRHEGVRTHVYQDHLGFWTIGVGRLVDERRGGGLSEDEIDYLLTNDITRVITEVSARIHFWPRLSDAQRQALCNMAFQLGIGGPMAFKRMLAALERGDWQEAKRQALDSKWSQQTPERAREVAELLTHAP